VVAAGGAPRRIEGNAGLALFELRLYEWQVRLELLTTRYPTDAPVLLTVWIRPTGAIARTLATVGRPIEGGWKDVARLPLYEGTASAAEDAMYAVRKALWSESAIRRRVSRLTM